MLRLRHQGDDAFRWARNETKREMVMSQSSYAKVAGLQSEIGRVVVTRVAGSELEYKRTLNMYRKDLAVNVNNIKREQIKMRRRMGRYIKKLKQTKIENAKRLKDEQQRDEERAALEELHIRLKMEAAARTPEPDRHAEENKPDVSKDSSDKMSISNIELHNNLYLQTGNMHEPEEQCWNSDSKANHTRHKKDNHAVRKESRVFSPILPMINEDAEKDEDESDKLNVSISEQETHTVDEFSERKTVDDSMSLSSYGGRKKKKNEVSFSDIIKLKYSGTKHLFDLVHILAKKHGIPDVVEEKVPDPRDSVVLRGSTNDSLRLQASVLYPIKYGYEYNDDDDFERSSFKSSKSPNVSSDNTDSNDKPEEEHSPSVPVVSKSRVRKLSLEQRRAYFMSGKHSKSVDEDEFHTLESRESTMLSKSRRTSVSMLSLVDKVAKIKLDRAERSSAKSGREVDNSHSGRLLSPLKPSSSHSSRSLPSMSKLPGRDNEKVSWTQAFGLLRAIHSLDDIR